MGGKGSGRKSISHDSAEIQKTMTEAGVSASHLLRDYIKGKDTHGNKVSITMVKLTACLQSIAHAIGLPRQKVEFHHTGDQLTLKDLSELAEKFDESIEKSIRTKLEQAEKESTVELTTAPKMSKN